MDKGIQFNTLQYVCEKCLPIFAEMFGDVQININYCQIDVNGFYLIVSMHMFNSVTFVKINRSLITNKYEEIDDIFNSRNYQILISNTNTV